MAGLIQNEKTFSNIFDMDNVQYVCGKCMCGEIQTGKHKNKTKIIKVYGSTQQNTFLKESVNSVELHMVTMKTTIMQNENKM